MSNAASAVDPKPTSPERPTWLTYLDGRIQEEKRDFDSNVPHYEIIRELLVATDHEHDAVPRAIHKFQDLYVSGFAGEDLGMREPPEYAAGAEFGGLAEIVFNTVGEVPFLDVRHDRLADLLIGIKKASASEFSPQNPQFVYYGWGLEAAAAENWNAKQVDGGMQGPRAETLPQCAEEWLSISALLAKLYKGGLLDRDGPLWISGDLERAFESRPVGDISTDLARQAQVLAIANCILIAGEPLAEEVRAPSQKRRSEFNQERWKLWATKLDEAAQAVAEDSNWDIKSRLQMAHDKMVELYPEISQ
ncbi:hypothetical protein FZEAL_7619 [Fusarium zealandicum]|uniref:Uncharacterized protein n=1 Tax=Fusarium zealandicum TaxID=1053134 RepID=A0A8H4UFE6_9HYPO|nr:hypothetical protein FZEAL_7619 [Fusarium zealandicum]